MAYARCNAAESAARMAGRARGFLIRLRGQGAGGGAGGHGARKTGRFSCRRGDAVPGGRASGGRRGAVRATPRGNSSVYRSQNREIL